MTVALVGGLDRLEQRYRSEAKHQDVDLRVFNKPTCNLSCKLAGVDAVILFTDLVSHASAEQVYKLARAKSVCLICSHNSSLSAARRCLAQAKQGRKAAENNKSKRQPD